MKKLYLALLVGLLAIPAFAQTNQTVLEQATDAAKQTVATNLNEVIVDILRGVKNAGGEVYAASKTAITKSVDFTMEQAPLVVKEFLAWKFVEACIWLSVWVVVGSLLFYVVRQLKLSASKSRSFSDEEVTAAKWVIQSMACIILIVAFTKCGMTIAKIKVAPRVYLIEYVVDALNPAPVCHQH